MPLSLQSPHFDPLVAPLLRSVLLHLSQNNNFGYKVITQREYQMIGEWFGRMHGTPLRLSIQNTHFFGAHLKMYATLIVAYSQQGDAIAIVGQHYAQLAHMVRDFDRRPILVTLSELDNAVDVGHLIKQETSRPAMLICSNPNIMTHSGLTDRQLGALLKLTHEREMTLICDESHSDLSLDHKSIEEGRRSGSVVIKRLGSLLLDQQFHKYMCVFGSAELRKQWASSNAYLKILPTDLMLAVIHHSMDDFALAVRQHMLDRIRRNGLILGQWLRRFEGKLRKATQNNQVYCIHKVDPAGRIPQLQSLAASPLAYSGGNSAGDSPDPLYVNLNCHPKAFEACLQQILAQPKL